MRLSAFPVNDENETVRKPETIPSRFARLRQSLRSELIFRAANCGKRRGVFFTDGYFVISTFLLRLFVCLPVPSAFPTVSEGVRKVEIASLRSQ